MAKQTKKKCERKNYYCCKTSEKKVAKKRLLEIKKKLILKI